MTVVTALTEQQIDHLSEFLESDQVEEGCLDFIAMHGFLTGIATGPESLLESSWLEFLFDGTPIYNSQEQQLEIESIIQQQATIIQRSLYLGEGIDLPCQLEVAMDEVTNDLTDWCFGFIEAIAVDETGWFGNTEITEAVAELILPAGLLSGQFTDPDLDHLIASISDREELANNLISNLENLYLLFRE